METHKKFDSNIYRSTSESSHFVTGYFTRNRSQQTSFSPSHKFKNILNISKHNSNEQKSKYLQTSSKISQQSHKYYSETKKVQYLLANESNLIEKYRIWTEDEKKKINTAFSICRHQINQILTKNQKLLEKMLDSLYQETLQTFIDIKLLAKDIFSSRQSSSHRSEYFQTKKNTSKYQRFRKKDNGNLVEDILEQENQYRKNEHLNKHYKKNDEKYTIMMEKANKFLEMSEKSVFKELEIEFKNISSLMSRQIEKINQSFQEKINSKIIIKKDNQQRFYNLAGKRKISEYGF